MGRSRASPSGDGPDHRLPLRARPRHPHVDHGWCRRGAQAGVLNAEALERMEKIDTLVVDKTGTLTEGKPKVVAVASPARSARSVVPNVRIHRLTPPRSDLMQVAVRASGNEACRCALDAQGILWLTVPGTVMTERHTGLDGHAAGDQRRPKNGHRRIDFRCDQYCTDWTQAAA
jgi:hypothetical protein